MNSKTEDVEIKLLLNNMFDRYGYDFRNYALSSLKRRIWKRAQGEGLSTISGLREKVFHGPGCMERLLFDLSVHVTDFFRDPGFYVSFRKEVAPLLRTFPFVRIWHAGCATGEEVYSMAILLQEENLLNRSKIYATDMNEKVLAKAKSGIFPLKSMQQFTSNYLKSGGKKSFSTYYTARYDNAIFNPELKKNMVFAHHNLATDSSFNEFNVILCRNVMIYFDRKLQGQVHRLFYKSLSLSGILVLGEKESMQFTPHEQMYKRVGELAKIYRKIK